MGGKARSSTLRLEAALLRPRPTVPLMLSCWCPHVSALVLAGYMPVDYYNLDSKYGTKEQLKHCIEEMHNHDLLVLGDVVLNHRCSQAGTALPCFPSPSHCVHCTSCVIVSLYH